MKADIHAARRVLMADADAAGRCPRERGHRLEGLPMVLSDDGCGAPAALRDAAPDEAVADLVEPFALRELVLRLRRRPPAATDRVCAAGLVINPAHRESLPTCDRLLDRVWRYGSDVRGDAVDTFVFVSHGRRTLEASGRPRIPHTVRGVGFVQRDDPSPAGGGR